MKLPTVDELKELRKGLRKQKLPKIFDGMWGSEPGVGGVKFTISDDDYNVEWVSVENEVLSSVKNVSWKSLCGDPALELQRLEIGLIFAELLEMQAQRVMDAIGGPIESLRESEPYRTAAKKWRHWAIVKAGHMIGL